MPDAPKESRLSRLTPWLVSAGALVVLAISAIKTPENLSDIQVCWFKAISGLPCPGCGLTRAFCSMSHGRFTDAWYFNPFSYAFYAVALLLVFYPLWLRLWPEGLRRMSRSKVLGWFMLGFVLAMWAFAIWRIRTGYGAA